MNSRFQKTTRDSKTYDRRSLEGSDNSAVLIVITLAGVSGRRRSISCSASQAKE
jgi:hypothetical protein